MADTIDEALEIVHRTGPEFGPGLSNHAPMGAEAMATMGRADGIIPWVEEYLPQLRPAPESVAPVVRGDWREALGDVRRVADWAAFFNRELADAPWQRVLANWTPRLAPAIMAAATHGLLRTAHAARSPRRVGDGAAPPRACARARLLGRPLPGAARQPVGGRHGDAAVGTPCADFGASTAPASRARA